jgi:hypothetical protein
MEKTLPKERICEVVEPECHPQVWSGLGLDTSITTVKLMDSFYEFRILKETNTSEDELGLSFLEDGKGLLCFTDGGKQTAMVVRLVGEDKTLIESGLGLPIDGHFGVQSSRKGIIVYSGTEETGLTGSSGLYIGRLEGNLVREGMKFGSEINTDGNGWTSYPSLNSTGEVLFFSSDRAGGFGGTDIWYSVREKGGEWSAAVNCGGAINTSCDEISPFVSPNDKELYFSSNGGETVGGYDIFKSTISEEFWSKIREGGSEGVRNRRGMFSNRKNERTPLNTVSDEIMPTC